MVIYSTGMFYRREPVMDSYIKDSNFPKNGVLLKGKESTTNPGWVLMENGLWLPLMQYGNVILHPVDK